MSVLFICTGNTCRSAMAQALALEWLRRRGIKTADIASAGLAAREGERASQGAQRAMQKRGLSLKEHAARRVTRTMLSQADCVLTMSPAQKEALFTACAPEKLHTLGEFAGVGGAVSDPYGGNEAAYEACAAQLERLVERAMERLYGNA